jgi:small-conductance mechanosensitive channel
MSALVKPILAQIPLDQITDLVDTTYVTPADYLWAFLALVVGIILSRLARRLARRSGQRANLPRNVIDLIGTVTMWSVVTLSVLFALAFIGLTVPLLWLAILLLVVLFAIGGRALFTSFGAGILLQSRAPFDPGDLVLLLGEQGVVVEINSRVVIIDTVDGRRAFLPNAQVIASPIINLSYRDTRMSQLLVDVAYGTDLEHAATAAVGSLEGLGTISTEPEPIAEVMGFEDSSVRIRVRFWHPSDQLSEWTAVDEAARAVYSTFRDEGIQIPFPQRTLWWGDPSTDTPT